MSSKVVYITVSLRPTVLIRAPICTIAAWHSHAPQTNAPGPSRSALVGSNEVLCCTLNLEEKDVPGSRDSTPAHTAATPIKLSCRIRGSSISVRQRPSPAPAYISLVPCRKRPSQHLPTDNMKSNRPRRDRCVKLGLHPQSTRD